MAKDETFIVLLFITLLDIASAGLYLSRNSSVINVGESFAVMCKDNGGQVVTWRGPRGPIRANTQPSVQDTAYGKLLKFNPVKKEHTGNYSCSLQNDSEEKMMFSLTVEDTSRFPYPEVDLQITQPPYRFNENKPNPYYPYVTHQRTTEITTEDTEYDQIETETSRFNRPNTRRPSYEEPMRFKDTPAVQRAVENQEVLLRCEVSGQAKISWSLVNEELTAPKYRIIGDGLLITNVSRNDSDKIFVCQASQASTGAYLDRKIKLIVEHKPKPVFEEYEKDVEVYGFLGESINLTCSVSAEPPPRFNWMKRTGKVLDVGTHESVLQVYMTERSPGRYQCIASNTHGQLETIFNLHIGTRPDPPEDVELQNATADSLILNVGLPQVPQEDIRDGMEPRWLVVQYRENGSEEWNFQEFNITQDYELLELEDDEHPQEATSTEEPLYEIAEVLYLTNLQPKTTYEVIAATKNIASLSEYTNSTYFQTSKAAYLRINSLINVIFLNLLVLFMSTPA